MKLRPEELKTHLAGALLPVYLVVGEDPLLSTEAADAIRGRAREQGFLEREVFQIDRPSSHAFQPAQHAAEALSLFASRRIVEIRLPGGKPGHGETELVRVIEAAGDDLLVLILAGKIEHGAWQSSDWLKRIDRRGASLALEPVGLARFPDWLRERFRAAGLVPEPDALALLVERTEGNLLAARQEIEKLALLLPAGARVDVAAVAASTGDSAQFDVFQLGRAVAAGDSPRALRLLAGLRAEGTAPVLVLWSLLQAKGGAESLPRGARRPAPALLTARAVRADRMAKGRLQGDVWDELMLLTTELCGLRVLPLSRWQLRMQAPA